MQVQDKGIFEPTSSGKRRRKAKIPPPATVWRIPFHKDLEKLGFNKILSQTFIKYCGIYEDFNAAFSKNPPIINWEKAKTLGSILINSKQA